MANEIVNQEMRDFSDNVTGLCKNFMSFHKELSDIDKKINDLYHIIEFIDLNAADASKVFKYLKRTLRKRRDIKDKISVVQGIPSIVQNPKIRDFDSLTSVECRRNKYKKEALSSLKSIQSSF
jgi:hypothetical protein